MQLNLNDGSIIEWSMKDEELKFCSISRSQLDLVPIIFYLNRKGNTAKEGLDSKSIVVASSILLNFTLYSISKIFWLEYKYQACSQLINIISKAKEVRVWSNIVAVVFDM